MNIALQPRTKSYVSQQTMTAICIEGGNALIDGRFVKASICIEAQSGLISGVDKSEPNVRTVNADGLFVLPGIVDMHGDAFERQIMPRPGVHFPIDVALSESDRQAIANGITTLFHGVTWSWEPGLRGHENARALLTGIENLRRQLRADTRFHLRHETYNLDAEAEIIDWISARRIDVLAFNDHMLLTSEATTRGNKLNQMIERSGLQREEFLALVERLNRRAPEVPKSIERLAKAASLHGIPLLSHDDTSPKQRQWFRSLGCNAAEFPTTAETAEAAITGGDHVVMGAPNVVRGGSHTGWIDATEMITRGHCSVLASDYYYPSLLLAPFLLAKRGAIPLEKAWALVSKNPAEAMHLLDRGKIQAQSRADLILVDPTDLARPRLVATIVGGKIAFLADADRMTGP